MGRRRRQKVAGSFDADMEALRRSCHLNRPISALLEEAGFHVTHLTAGYMKRPPKPMTFLYEGSASRD